MAENELHSAFEFAYKKEEGLTLEEAVFQALGAASMCWDSPELAGVFHSDRAKDIGEKLIEMITLTTKEKENETAKFNPPVLKLATTEELLSELQLRAVITGYATYRRGWRTIGET